MKQLTIISMTAFALFAFASCSDDGYTATNRPVPPLIKIDLTEAERQQVKANNNFAFDLSREVMGQSPKNNFLISPLSATYVLAMLENGSANETQRQILSALHYDDEASMNTVCNRLIDGAPKIDASTEVNIANGLFMDKSFPFKSEYVKSMQKVFGAETKNLDFKNRQAVVNEVNGWSNEKTKGKIPHIIDIDNVSPGTKLMALNAIYFKGIWQNEFARKKTSKQSFTHADGKRDKVDMMQTKENFLYGSFPKFDMLHLSYGNNGYSMEVLLPKEGVTTEEVLGSIKSADWQETMMAMRAYQVDVQLPKFTAEYSIDMPSILKALGMNDMFDSHKADFSRLSDIDTFLSLFRQKCTIDVNEKGTEGTTITVSGGGETTSYIPTVEFHANRPFIYIITENTSGSIYFMGIFK
ncbi:serpin family protein [Prevotella sp. A2931]|uniref:Serpin family protein n=1 Tax=Prevotella illustrans TaxID=2800387 RepID=A0ABS3M6R8_9BACT|nr:MULTISPECIES: serpin family protein [Prevotella]MBO1363815.1 serpin family protein [Prevotella illustrans]PTL26773.1 peptidase inhibitor [Prevotella sp. oral taxon 820]